MGETGTTELERFGLVRGIIYESIVSTYSPDGTPNAAPMGIKLEDMRSFTCNNVREHIIIEPFKATQTYKNLKQKGCAVVNFIVDPSTFYKTAFKDEEIAGDYFHNFFEKATVVDAPRLREVDAFLEVSVLELKDDGKRAQVTCSVDHWRVLASPFRPYCRGVFAVIEAVIHATRIRVFLAQDNNVEARRLIELVDYYKRLIGRVAPNSEYSKIIDEVMARIEIWKRKWPNLK